MKIIRKLNVEMELQGFKPVFLVNNRVMETGLTVRKGFGLLSDEVQCNGTKAWFYAVKIGEYATDGKAQVYKLSVSNKKATTSDFFVRATSLNTIEEETKSVLEKLYGTQIINDVKIYEVEGHVVDFGFKKHELSIYGSTMFGLLVWDAIEVDCDDKEWVYGVEIGGEVVNGKTRVYRLQIVSDVIVFVDYTEYWIPVRPLLVKDVLRRKKKAGLVWLNKITCEKGKYYNCAVKLEDAIIAEEKVIGNKVVWVCPMYEARWNKNDAIGDPNTIVRFGQTCFLKR